MEIQKQTEQLIKELYAEITPLFPDEKIEAYLFGSYARGDSESGSDVDVMFLVDASREEIAAKNWLIGDAAGEILVDHGILISPIVENRRYFTRNADVIPLFRNIIREGIPVHV